MEDTKQDNSQEEKISKEKNINDIKNIKINKDFLKKIIVGIVGFAVVILIFGVGIFVGGLKARFSYNWAESYHKNFAGPQGGFFGDFRQAVPPPGDFIEGHGTFGEIIKINSSDFVIKGQGDVEKIIIIKDDTILEEERATIKKDDLKVGDRAVVIGSPNNQGQIEAKLIRVFSGEGVGSPLPSPSPLP